MGGCREYCNEAGPSILGDAALSTVLIGDNGCARPIAAECGEKLLEIFRFAHDVHEGDFF